MGWYGVDLDGTLALYDSWRGFEHIGAPVPLMVGRVKQWIAEGRDVRIMTARVSGAEDIAEKSRRVIQAWCVEHLGQELPVTCEKDFAMICLYDDRVVQVEENTGRLLGREK